MDAVRSGATPSSQHGVRHALLGVAVDGVLPESWDCRGLVGDVLRVQGAEVLETEIRVPSGPDRGWVVAARDQVVEQLPAVGEGAPDVVHAVGWPATLAAVAARAERELPAIVAHLGNGPGVPGRTVDPDLHRLAWVSARAADVVVLDSYWAVEQAVSLGVSRSAIVQATPVGLPVEHPANWTRHDGPARVLAVGGVGPLSGTHALLRAVAGLDGIELVVAARAEATDAQVASAQHWLDELCRRLGAQHAAVRPMTPALLASVDLVVDAGVVPGSVDGMVRAMAGRRAVLATDMGSRAEVVSSATTGEVVAPGDWRALRRALVHLLGDPFKLEAYGDAGLERYLAVHTPQRRAMVVEEAASRVGAA